MVQSFIEIILQDSPRLEKDGAASCLRQRYQDELESFKVDIQQSVEYFYSYS